MSVLLIFLVVLNPEIKLSWMMVHWPQDEYVEAKESLISAVSDYLGP